MAAETLPKNVGFCCGTDVVNAETADGVARAVARIVVRLRSFMVK